MARLDKTIVALGVAEREADAAQKGNPYHDEQGRFSSGDAGGGGEKQTYGTSRAPCLTCGHEVTRPILGHDSGWKHSGGDRPHEPKVSVTAELDHRGARAKEGPWVVGAGGKEEPFTAQSGARLQYMYQPSTGTHAYYDIRNDMILSDQEAAMHMGQPIGPGRIGGGKVDAAVMRLDAAERAMDTALKYSADQERDDRGRFAGGGGESSGDKPLSALGNTLRDHWDRVRAGRPVDLAGRAREAAATAQPAPALPAQLAGMQMAHTDANGMPLIHPGPDGSIHVNGRPATGEDMRLIKESRDIIAMAGGGGVTPVWEQAMRDAAVRLGSIWDEAHPDGHYIPSATGGYTRIPPNREGSGIGQTFNASTAWMAPYEGKTVKADIAKYSPDQPRAEDGKFGEGSGGASTSDKPAGGKPSGDSKPEAAAKPEGSKPSGGPRPVKGHSDDPAEDFMRAFKQRDMVPPSAVASLVSRGWTVYSAGYGQGEPTFDSKGAREFATIEKDDLWRFEDAKAEATPEAQRQAMYEIGQDWGPFAAFRPDGGSKIDKAMRELDNAEREADLRKYSADQERDDHGRFGSGEGGAVTREDRGSTNSALQPRVGTGGPSRAWDARTGEEKPRLQSVKDHPVAHGGITQDGRLVCRDCGEGIVGARSSAAGGWVGGVHQSDFAAGNFTMGEE